MKKKSFKKLTKILKGSDLFWLVVLSEVVRRGRSLVVHRSLVGDAPLRRGLVRGDAPHSRGLVRDALLQDNISVKDLMFSSDLDNKKLFVFIGYTTYIFLKEEVKRTHE